MSDLESLEERIIRVAHNYGAPLKEDKRGEGALKLVPAPRTGERLSGWQPNLLRWHPDEAFAR